MIQAQAAKVGGEQLAIPNLWDFSFQTRTGQAVDLEVNHLVQSLKLPEVGLKITLDDSSWLPRLDTIESVREVEITFIETSDMRVIRFLEAWKDQVFIFKEGKMRIKSDIATNGALRNGVFSQYRFGRSAKGADNSKGKEIFGEQLVRTVSLKDLVCLGYQEPDYNYTDSGGLMIIGNFAIFGEVEKKVVDGLK